MVGALSMKTPSELEKHRPFWKPERGNDRKRKSVLAEVQGALRLQNCKEACSSFVPLYLFSDKTDMIQGRCLIVHFTKHTKVISVHQRTQYKCRTNERSVDRFEHDEFPHVTSKFSFESKSWWLVTEEDLLAAV